MKVFVSSVIRGMEPLRAAARAAIESLDATPLMAEDRPASPSTPQGACFSLVDDADAVVVLFGERYGTILPSGHSATEEECRHARKQTKPVLAFVTSPHREPRQQELLDLLSSWESGVFRAETGDQQSLQREVVRALRGLMSSADPKEVNASINSSIGKVQLLPGHNRSGGAWIASACVPEQRINVDEDALFRDAPVLIGNLCVTGEVPLTQERPHVSLMADGILYESPAPYAGLPRLRVWLGTRLEIAIGGTFQRRERGRFEDSLFARPSDARATLVRQFEVMHDVLRRFDPRNVLQRCAIQTSLGNLGIANFTEDSGPHTGGVAVNMDGDRLIEAYGSPASVLVNDLKRTSDLPDKVVARLIRAANTRRH